MMSAGANQVCAYQGDVAGQTLTAYIDRLRSPVHTAGPYQWSCFSYQDNCTNPSRTVRVELNTNTPAFTCSVTDTRMQCHGTVPAQIYDAQTGENLGTMTSTGTLVLARDQ